jgi:hypothetical protein
MGIRIIIAGSKTVDPPLETIDAAVRELMAKHQLEGVTHGDPPEFVAGRLIEVICSCAPGSGWAATRWAEARGVAIWYEPVTEQDVRLFGKYRAPQERHRRMAERAAAAVLFWDGMSAGTPDLHIRLGIRGKPVNVVPWKAGRRRKRDGDRA